MPLPSGERSGSVSVGEVIPTVVAVWLTIAVTGGIPVVATDLEFYRTPQTAARHAAMWFFWPITIVAFVVWGAYLCLSPARSADG